MNKENVKETTIIQNIEKKSLETEDIDELTNQLISLNLSKEKTPTKKERLIPNYDNFNTTGNILMVGEGTFSFAKVFVEYFQDLKEKIVATELRTKENLLKNYDLSFQENYDCLIKENIRIEFKIDCTKIHEIYSKEHISTIIWNAPYSQKPREKFGYLIQKFFESAVQIQKKEDNIFLRLTTSETYFPKYEKENWIEFVKKHYQEDILECDSIINYEHRFNTPTIPIGIEFKLYKYTKFSD